MAHRTARLGALAALGEDALRASSSEVLMEEIVRVLRDACRAQIALVLELSADGSTLRPRIAAGLDCTDMDGATELADGRSQAGYALRHNAPVIVTDLARETRFSPCRMLLDHGAICGMSVAIRGRARPYGVLAVFRTRRRRFAADDVQMLAATAGVLGLSLGRAHAEAQLRASEVRSHLLASIVGQSEDAILTRDLDDVIVSWNPGAERLYGYSALEAIGRKARELQLRDMSEQEYRRVLARIRGGQPVRFETRCTTKDGQAVYVFGTAGPMYDDAGKQIGEVVVARDVTELRKARKALQQANNALEQRVAERTAQLEAAYREAEALSYSIAHDLRAPLRAISGYARILEDELAPILPDQAQRYLKRMGNNAVRLGALIDALLSLQRLSRQPLARTASRLNEAVEDALNWLRGEQPGRDIQIAVDELGAAEVDPALIRLAFANLLSNAIKFTRGRNPACVTVGTLQREGEQVYFVQDNGAGFDMRFADKLFGVFQRLHPEAEYEGSGIGLASVHRIVQRHGGRIWAEAEVDRGATFYFTLGKA
ncbi:MAG: PAS domain S-box protein [Burkholderiales bacterium]|nr:PAS domain S-box protein [Burkholderiales bacterium]